MGQIMRNALFIAMMACLLCMPATYGARADLIEPTRTLKDENVIPGKLFVFSEPPGLVVTLDGKALGKSPVYLDSVAQGPHEVQVAGKDTTIVIAPGEVRRLSFFKGKFIDITSEEAGASEQPQTAEQKPAQKPESEQKAQKSEKLEPGYFPLNPRGPIY
jgi:hypothetical protein